MDAEERDSPSERAVLDEGVPPEAEALPDPADRETILALEEISGTKPSPPGASDVPEVRAFLARIRERKEALAILVEHAAAVLLEGSRLVVLYNDTQTFLRKSAEQPANVAILGEIAVAVLGPGGTAEIRRGQAAGSTGRNAVRETADAGAGAAAEDVSGLERSGDLFADEPESEPPLDDTGVASGARAAAIASSALPPSPPPREASSSPRPASSASPDAPPASAAPAGAPTATGARYQRLHAQALEDPVVKSLVSRFGGRIVEIKEVP